ERFLEALVEGGRALVAHTMSVRDVDAIEPRIVPDREPPLCTEDFGRGFMTVRHRAGRIEAGELAAFELAGGHTVVDVAERAQALMDCDRARREDAHRSGRAEKPACE